MREIEFRGKDTETGKWVFGDLTHVYLSGNLYITNRYGNNYKIIPETIGQYTGLKDKNGKKIFEGHIVKRFRGVGYESKYHRMIHKNPVIHIFQVEYDNENAQYKNLQEPDDIEFIVKFEVIGNIYDNPELLIGNIK